MATYESIDISVGYSEEVDYENDKELNDRIVYLNTKINTQLSKSFDYLKGKYWANEPDESKG
jgi:hypothetical protein